MSQARIEIELSTKGATAVQRTLEGLVGSVRGFALNLAGVLGAAFTTREFVSRIKEAVDHLDRLAATSQKVGVLTSTLSTMEYAAAINKGSAEQLETAYRFLSKAMVDAAGGGRETTAAFETLGVAFTDSEGRLRGTNDVLLDLADRFAELPNGAQKTALALQLFGRSGTETIPMLNAGADALRELQAEAKALGLEAAPWMAQAAGDFNDNVERLEFAAKGFFLTATKEVLPALVAMSQQMIDAAKSGGTLQAVAQTVGKVLKEVAWTVMALKESVGLLATAFDVVTDFLSIFFFALRQLWQVVTDFTGHFRGNLEAMATALMGFGEVFELVLTRRFKEAAAKAKAIMADLTLSTTKLAAQAVGDVAKVSNAFDNTAAYAREVRSGASAKLGGAAALVGFNMLRYEAAAEPSAIQVSPSLAAGAFGPGGPPSAEVGRKNVRSELDAQAQSLAAARQRLAGERATMEASIGIVDAEKWRQRLEFLRTEKELLDAQVVALRDKLAVTTDEQSRQQIASALFQAEQESRGLGNQMDAVNAHGDPTSMRDQLLATITDLQNRIGTMAQSVARAFSNVVQSSIDGVAAGIEGLIRGTMSWGDALRNIASTIYGSIISAISKMFAEWIVKRGLLAAKNILFAQAEGAAETAAKTPGAILSSISSFGLAAVVGVAAVMAALAATGAFAQGGLVQGPGGPTSDSVLARLSNGEYVLNADAVAHYGQPLLEAMNQRQAGTGDVAAGGGSGGVSSGGSTGSNLNLVLVDSRRHARDFLAGSEGERMVLDIIRRNKLQVGIRT